MSQLLKDLNDFLGVRRSDLTSLTKDSLQFVTRYIIEVNFEESIPESSRQDLSSGIQSWRILCGEQDEVRVGTNDLLSLGDDQLSIVVEQPVQGFKHVGRSKIEFI
jgi:hypothetical protein